MPNMKPLALALIVSLTAGTASFDADAQKKKKAPAKKPVVEAITACTDFYAYTNKDWLQANTMLAGSGMMSSLGQLSDRALQQQRDLLDNAMRMPQGNVQKLLGDFWASGLDETASEADGSNAIAPLLTRINGIRRARDVPAAIAALHQVGIPVAFNFSADIDLNDLDRHIGYFSQGGTGLPDPAYYTRTDADTRALLGRYNNYVQKILTLTGTPADKIAAEAQAVIDLETRIAQSSKPLTLLRDPRANYAPVAVNTLGGPYKQLQLVEFLKAQGVTDDTVSMANPELFAQLNALVASLNPDQWKTYLRYQVGNAMAPHLSKGFRDAEFEFRGRVLRGEKVPLPRWQQTLNAINTAAGPMLGREYAGRYLPAATKSRAETIGKQVRDALGRGVDRNTWMSAPAKAEAKSKLDKLRIEVGTPRRDLDYTIQPMGRGSFGGNMLIASTWHHREEMKRIGRGNAERRWNVLPQQPALAYDLAHNRLIVTAAMLQPPVLDMAQDAAGHYGTYGALVGHELSHAVDNKGRNVDAAGNLRDWWTPADTAAWDSRVIRVGSQYDGYAYPQLTGVRVNGRQTRDENAADIAGIELAWDAYITAQPGALESAKQAFYQSWARLWAQQSSVDAATLMASNDLHAPGQWRTNGPLVNQPSFAEAFQCKATQPMVKEAFEQIALWR
ncbi:MAG: M13 family metallopeptidase [Pseudomonadota bacterium]|nr:M13 family metallopeptidase [Pseudomonadota bacterium]MDQ3228743.1 M13 family metallopeptidase [Pseudomonadota bacterium]